MILFNWPIWEIKDDVKTNSTHWMILLNWPIFQSFIFQHFGHVPKRVAVKLFGFPKMSMTTKRGKD
jgi:hypothetical protein